MSAHNEHGESDVPARPLIVIGGGGPLARLEVMEALLWAVPWTELAAAIAPERDVPIPVELWGHGPIVRDARRLDHDPQRALEMLAELGLLGMRAVLLFSPEEERIFEMMEPIAHSLRHIEIAVEPVEAPPPTAEEILVELIERDEAVLWLRWPDVVVPTYSVSFQMPLGDLYVGTYHKVPVIIHPASGLGIDDLQFIVPAGPAGGQVSLSRDKRFDPLQPDVMLLVGYEPGSYRLQALDKHSGQLVGQAGFSVTALWPDDRSGPSFWTTGDYELPGVPGAAWGGGSTTDPENWNVIPATGTRQVAILLVDTKSQRFKQSDVATIRTRWANVAFNGHTHNGKTVSTAHYFTEGSYGKFTIAGQVFGPVSLSGEWSDYFQDNGKYKANIWQACATAGDSLIDYAKFQSLVCVFQPVDATATTPKRSVWPHADSMVAKTAEGDVALGTVVIHADGDLFRLSATLAHELGHNLRLGDIYEWGGHPPNIRARQLRHWALMAWESRLPHPVLVHRMRLGWMPKKNLKLYNFQAIAGSVDETVTLHPIEQANPPAGRYSGVEVRIAPNWNYYFEYRVAQATQIGDQNLETNDRVLGTDADFSDTLEDAQRRKPVMLLPNDIDGDGPILGLNQDYEEQDVSPPEGPNFPTDFSATVTAIGNGKADLRIKYGVYSQPDPSIRPWNPPVYKSPDIEVRNARNQADPKWHNVPWENHHNTLVAKVTNRGAMNAPGVWVDFYVKDFTVNNTKGIIKIGSDQKDVPAGQTVEFSTIWMPAKAGHYCIEARIRLYMTPGPNPVLEVTEFNNRAQTNYDRFISAKASAPSRQVATVKVQNPYDQPTRVFIRCARSTSPLYRTYLEHTWLWLEPGETRDLEVMFEYAEEEDQIWTPYLEQYIGLPNDVSVCALIDEPGGDLEQAPILLGGFTVQVVTGRATRIGVLDFDPPSTARGWVTTVDTREPVPGGQVLLILKRGQRERYRLARVSPDGEFFVDASGAWDSIQAYYVPIDGYGDCYSRLLQRP